MPIRTIRGSAPGLLGAYMDPKGSGYPVSGVCIMQLLCRSHCIRNKVTVTTSKSVCSIVTDGIGVLLCSPFIVGFKGVLHPRPVFGLFLHFSQKLQHIGNN